MPRSHKLRNLWFCALTLGLQASPWAKGTTLSHGGGHAVAVEVRTDAQGKFTLIRGGKRYFIRGADGAGFFAELAAAGGNSVRTYGDESTDPVVFAEARQLGLTVLAGLWLPHTDEGFNYADPKQVRQLVQHLKRYVERYKNSPEILMWDVGNEVEADGSNPDIWRAIEQVASMVRATDPLHPVLTSLAEVTPEKIAALKKYDPSIEVLGINSYASIFTLASRLAAAGWNRPYVITEFGPPGPWGQVPTTSWKAPIEPTSTGKARFYYDAYEDAVAAHPHHCLGSYVYYWGIEPKIVTTHTWYEMFLPEGHEPLGAVESMKRAWTRTPRGGLAPQIHTLDSTARDAIVRPQSLQSAQVIARMPDGGHLRFTWEVRAESKALSGPPPPVIPGSIIQSSGRRVVFRAPLARGPYRLFVYVYGSTGYAATANFPFFVKSAVMSRPGIR